MKATLKGSYDVNKNAGATAILAVNAGDVKLSASVTEATFIDGPSLNGLAFALEKPDSFVVNYNVSKKDFGFKFTNTVTVGKKPLNLKYEHKMKEKKTVLEGTFELDPANKIGANYAFDSRNYKLKYTYVHDKLTTFEPSYDMAKNTWDFAISRRLYGDNTLKASYETSNKVLGLQWAGDFKYTASFKIAASVKLTDELKAPKLSAETTWNFEM